MSDSVINANALKRVYALKSQLGLLSVNNTAAPAQAQVAPVSIIARENGVAIIQINFAPVNSFHPSVQEGIKNTFNEALKDSSIKAIVITGSGKNFMAGADIEYIRSMQQANNSSVDQIKQYVKTGNELFIQIEKSSKPVVAAVNGIALGGGCELAMTCAARVSLGSASFGLPELTLGIIPGLGGTQRLPRLVGVEKAVSMTLSSKPIKAAEAQKLGLVDVIVKNPNELLLTAGKLALDIANGKVPRREALSQTNKLSALDKDLAVVEMARVNAFAKSKGAPHVNVYCEAVKTGLLKGGLAGIQAEIDGLANLVLGPVSRSLIHFFFASRATSKVPGVPESVKGAKGLQRVAVIGGGTMGAGICIVYLLRGYDVVLKEVNDKLLLAAVERIIDQLTRVVKARKLPTMAIEFMMRKLQPQTTFNGFDSIDLVIEAIIENVQIKQNLFAELEKLCPKHAILATNTSTIDVELIGQKTKAQDRIIGLHFFSPAHVMPLLEIVRTKLTSPETVSRCLAMSKKIGKTPVVVGNCVGFIANRIFFPYGQSASLLVDCGVSPYRIDAALESFGMPMGVFRMFDLSGVDIGMHVSEQINGAYGSRCYNSTLGKHLFAAKRLGQKTGAGYYKYASPGGKPIKVQNEIEPFIAKARAEASSNGKLPSLNDKSLTDKEIVEMILFPIVNESARAIVEGFANSAADVDVCSVMGYGFPSMKGGIMFFGGSTHQGNGLKRVVERLAEFSNRFGKDSKTAKAFFEPSPELKQLASKSSN